MKMNPVGKRNRSAVITAILTIGGTCAVVAAFVGNASPYGTFNDAKRTHAESIHVAGDLIPNSVKQGASLLETSFQLKDTNGELMTVEYSGPPQSNLEHATRVVAIGGVDGPVFKSKELLVKCPSKYKSATKS
jgi:cytochrome c-type biogenesis protein CcmE